jgi:hypothetical protein
MSGVYAHIVETGIGMLGTRRPEEKEESIKYSA